jgi:uncharacterized protein (TIRG00374 family)
VWQRDDAPPTGTSPVGATVCVLDYPAAVSPTLRRVLQAALLLGFGGVVLASVVQFFGAAEVAQRLRDADRGLLALAAAVFFTQFFTMGLRWWVTLRLLGHDVAAIPLFRANAAANFVNFFAPGHFGEPLLATWLARTGRAPGVEAFSALVGSKVVATILSFCLLVACVPLLVTAAEASWLSQVAGAAGALAVGTVGAWIVLLRPSVASAGAALLARTVGASVGLVRPALASRVAGSTEALVLGVRDGLAHFGSRPVALLGSAALSATKVASQIGFVTLLYRAFGQEVTVAGAAFLVTVNVLQNAISIWIPANLGVQEALLVAAAAGGLAIDGSVAASAALAQKAILIVHVLLGAAAFVVLGWFDRPGSAAAAGGVSSVTSSRPTRSSSDPAA